jgi:hypothetical protein
MNSAVVFLTLIFIQASALASDSHQAIITRTEGRVQIFSEPSNQKSTQKVFFEGKYFELKNAAIGDRIKNGSIVRTLPGSRAHLIYENGDQIQIGPGTSYQVRWKATGSKHAPNEFKLFYGKMRGVILKEGTKNKFEIKTKTAVMGVRGTDFFIEDEGNGNATQITVVRGEVSVTTPQRETLIKTGMTATATLKSPVEIHETTKEDLKAIGDASAIIRKEASPELVAKLEQKAIEVTLQDVKTYQPEIYEKLPEAVKKNPELISLQNQTIQLVAENAPSAPAKKSKPTLKEFKKSDDQDVYEKYYKKDN